MSNLRYPKTILNFFRDAGFLKISKIVVKKQPINDMIDKALNFLSLGKFQDKKSEMGYDKLFHLYIIFELENGKMYMAEKNELIKITDKIRNDTKETETMQCETPDVDIFNFFDKTKELLGDYKFFTYDPLTLNCQNFIFNLLSCNGIITEQLKGFILQQMEGALDEFTSKFARTITDKAGDLNHWIQDTFGINIFRNGGRVKKLRKNNKYSNVKMKRRR